MTSQTFENWRTAEILAFDAEQDVVRLCLPYRSGPIGATQAQVERAHALRKAADAQFDAAMEDLEASVADRMRLRLR